MATGGIALRESCLPTPPSPSTHFLTIEHRMQTTPGSHSQHNRHNLSAPSRETTAPKTRGTAWAASLWLHKGELWCWEKGHLVCNGSALEKPSLTTFTAQHYVSSYPLRSLPSPGGLHIHQQSTGTSISLSLPQQGKQVLLGSIQTSSPSPDSGHAVCSDMHLLYSSCRA